MEFEFTPNENFKYFFQWMTRRQQIFWNRLNGDNPPYTLDPILLKHKFTNVYRSLDRVSQYMLRFVIYNGKQYSREDMFWRILIFKHFNKIDTWEYILSHLGDVTLETRKDQLFPILHRYTQMGGKPYSNAFLLAASIMQSKPLMERYGLKAGNSKYEIYLSIFEKHFLEDGFMNTILSSKSLEEIYIHLRETPAFANFLAMQYATDFNWSEIFDFDENSFIVESVGSQRGINRTFTFEGKPDYPSVIKWVHHEFHKLLTIYNCSFKPLPNYMPSLMDIQNCFCETDKYMRGLDISSGVGGKRIKAKFRENKSKIEYTFPPSWNVNL